MPWVPRDENDFPSLGWGVVDWAEASFRLSSAPDDELRMYLEQVEWYVRWFEINPETGQFVKTSGLFVGPQGIGKSPIVGSILALAALRGPVVFDGWDADGQPVGVPMRNPWFQIWSESEDLTTNMYEPARWMADNARERGLADWVDVDAGDTRIRFKGERRGLIEFKTQKPKPGEQINAGAAMDETGWWMPAQRGPERARMVRSNADKTFHEIGRMTDPRSVDSPDVNAMQSGRAFSVSNQPLFGEDSVAEFEMTELAQDADFLLLEMAGHSVADPKNPENVESLRRSLRKSHGSALTEAGGHMPLESRVAACQSSKYDKIHVQRYFLSMRVRGMRAGQTPFCDVDSEWNPLCEPRELLENEPVILTLDPSRSQDSTMLRAWAVGDGKDVLPYTWRDPDRTWAWVRPENAEEWSVSAADVFPEVLHLVETLNVVCFAYDAQPWSYDFDRLQEERLGELGEGGIMLSVSTSKASRFGPMIDDFSSAMRSGGFRHNGDHWGGIHLGNAVKGEAGGHTRVTKEYKTSPRKIDDVITMIIGWDMVQGYWSGDWSDQNHWEDAW